MVERLGLSISKGDFDGERYNYTFSFEWSGVNALDFSIEWYHSQTVYSNWSGTGIFDYEANVYFMNINVPLYPYCRYVVKYTHGVTSGERELITSNHPSHLQDSYIKTNRVEIHDQYADYEGAKYKYEASSCVANTLCAGMDTCYLNLYSNPIRPSVGYLYGALLQDKGEDYGLEFVPTLNYLKTRGVARASSVIGDARKDRYPNNYLKQPRSIELWGGGFKTFNGAVQVFNANQSNSKAIETEKYAMISGWTKGFSMGISYSLMNALMDNNKLVMATLGLCTEFDSASNRGGVCGRLIKTSAYRGGHSALVIGWKKIESEYYWIFQNSWGANRGDNGLMYVPFSWHPITNDNNVAYGGLWEFYIIDYKNNGKLMLPVIQPPILNTESGIDGRGDRGLLYLKWNKPTYDLDGGYCYTIRFVYENGSSETKVSYSPDVDGVCKDYFYMYKYGETIKISIMYTGRDYGEKSVWSSENMATTLPKEPVLSNYKVSNNIVTMDVSVSEGNYTDVAVHYSLDNVYKGTVIVPKGSNIATFANLIKGNTYTFVAETRFVVRGVTLKSFNKSNTLIVSIESGVEPFYWTTQIVASGEILNNTGAGNVWYAYPITSTEWNSYIDTLEKVRELKKISINRPLNTVGRGMPIITYINQAIDALNDMLTTKINKVTTTSTLTAQVFLDLQNKLNDIIKTL